ncbi:MAG: hypothetical protein ABIT58_08405 [Ferruginibacter sp.]
MDNAWIALSIIQERHTGNSATSSWMINTDKAYMAGFRYIVTKYFSLGTHYDIDMGLGAGFVFTY